MRPHFVVYNSFIHFKSKTGLQLELQVGAINKKTFKSCLYLVLKSKEGVAFNDAFVSHSLAGNPNVTVNQLVEMLFLDHVSRYFI